MKILVINCSPVRNGATAEIVNTVKQCVENENTVKTVRALLFGYKFYSRSILPIPK